MNRPLAVIFALATTTLYGCPDDKPMEPGGDAGANDGGIVPRDAQPGDARVIDAMPEDAGTEDAAGEDATARDATAGDAGAGDATPGDAMVGADAGPRPCPSGFPRALAAEMSVLPSAQPMPMMWRSAGNLGEEVAVTNNMDGTITIRDMYADTFLLQTYAADGCPAAAGDVVTIEWRANAVSTSPDPYGVVLLYTESNRILAVAMHPNEVFFYDNPTGMMLGRSYTFSPGFHEFRLERRYPPNLEGTVELYVDNVLALTQTATSFPNVASAGGVVTFGAAGGFSTSESIWDYVRYSVP